MTTASRRSLIIGVIVLLLVAGLVSWLVFRDSTTNASTAPSPSEASTQAASIPSAASPSASQCTPLGDGFVPTEFVMPDSDVVSPVLSLGRDENDAAAAPPVDASHTTGWFNEGPKAASSAGKILLTIHTYRQGGALGNEMYQAGPAQVEVGDRMQLRDDSGNLACYQVSAIEKIWVSDYDPTSDAIYDNDGDPQIAVVICWDFNHENEAWDSRIVYYADPAPQAG